MEQKQGIDYTPLENAKKVPKIWPIVGYSGVLLVVLGFVISYIQASAAGLPINGDTSTGTVGGTMIASGIAACLIGVIMYARIFSKITDQSMALFMQQNNWHKTGEVSFDHVATSVLGVGDSRKVTEAYVGNYNGRPFNLTVYEYKTGSGKSRQTYNYVSLSFKLEHSFPFIVLDDAKNNSWGLSDLPGTLAGTHVLELEGGFSKRFKVSVNKGTERVVLQLLTPDFMAELLDAPRAANVELQADQLFVIIQAGIIELETLRALFGMSDIVLKNIKEVSDSWQASSSQTEVEEITAKALVQRRRMIAKTSGLGIVGGIILYGLYLIAMVFNGSGGVYGPFVVAALVLVLFFRAYIQGRRGKR